MKWKLLSCVQLFATPWPYSPWNSPGQNTGVGSLSLLQGIFPTQGSNPGLLNCWRILYHLSHPEWLLSKAQKMTSVEVRMWRNWNPCVGRSVKCCSCCRKRSGSSSNIQHKITLWSSSSTSGYRPQRSKSRDLSRYVYTKVQGSITTAKRWKQPNVQLQMNKQNGIYTHTRLLFSLKKECNSDSCSNMDEPWRHYPKRNEPDTKQIFHDLIYKMYLG